MKRTKILGIVMILAGCSAMANRDLNLRYEVVDLGRSLRLSWDLVDGADYYRVLSDGIPADSTPGPGDTSLTLTPEKAGGIITVEAVGTDTYEALDLSPLEYEVILFSREDPDTLHPEAAGFHYYYLERYFLWQTEFWDYIDFYIGDENADTLPDINSPRVYGINNEYNLTAAWGTGDVAPDTGYAQTTDLVPGSDVALWLTWDQDYDAYVDNFARIQVNYADSFRVELTVYYQYEPGLKWVVK